MMGDNNHTFQVPLPDLTENSEDEYVVYDWWACYYRLDLVCYGGGIFHYFSPVTCGGKESLIW